MRKAWADHLVLLWREQHLPDISFLDAAGIFGVTKEPAARKYQLAGGYKVGGKIVPLHPHVSLISNLNENGEPVMDNGALGSAEVVWHSDNSYTEVPPAGSMLAYANELATCRAGDQRYCKPLCVQISPNIPAPAPAPSSHNGLSDVRRTSTTVITVST